MNYNKSKVERYREKYPAGTEVELIYMDDPCTYMHAGLKGVVDFVDDACQIHCRWENGSGLALIPGVDKFRVVTVLSPAAEPKPEDESDGG